MLRKATIAAAALFAGSLLAAAPVRAEPMLHVTNATQDGFWVTAFSENEALRAVSYAQISYHVSPGQTAALACGGSGSCDVILARSPDASAPLFRNIQGGCIRVTTYNQSRANAAYSAC
jgi:hypothetical protein